MKRIILGLGFGFSLFAGAIEIAITVDDHPSHGKPAPDLSREQIVSRIAVALKKAGVTKVLGFANGGKPDGDATFKIWRENGHLLGNHTATHPWLAKVTAEAYIDDILANEKHLAKYDLQKWFRYPFLAEGDTAEKRRKVREFLAKAGYRVAQVTIDSNDWAFNDPYTRCLELKDTATARKLVATFLLNAETELSRMERLAHRLYGRAVRHILLLHVGSLTSAAMPELLRRYQAGGVKFISLEEASADPLYAEDPDVLMSYGFGFLNQWADKKKITLPDNPYFDIKKLEETCR